MCVCTYVFLAENSRIPGSGKNLLVPGGSLKELDADLFQRLLLEACAGPFQGFEGKQPALPGPSPFWSVPILHEVNMTESQVETLGGESLFSDQKPFTIPLHVTKPQPFFSSSYSPWGMICWSKTCKCLKTGLVNPGRGQSCPTPT